MGAATHPGDCRAVGSVGKRVALGCRLAPQLQEWGGLQVLAVTRRTVPHMASRGLNGVTDVEGWAQGQQGRDRRQAKTEKAVVMGAVADGS